MSEKKIIKRVIQKHVAQDDRVKTAVLKEAQIDPEVQDQRQVYYTEEPGSSDQNDEREVVIQSSGSVGEGVPAIDLMNFKLVRFEEADGQLGGHYRLVTNSEEQPIMTTINGEEVLFVSGDTIDIEQISKSDDDEHQNNEGSSMGSETKYVQLQMEGSDGPIVMLACESTPTVTEAPAPKNRPLQQKQYFKNNVSNNVSTTKGGRGSLPPPHELMSSPNFKLFLYACKQCDYQCNAIRDLTKHRAEKHGGSSRNRNSSSWTMMRSSVNRKPDLSPYPAQSSSTTTQKL